MPDKGLDTPHHIHAFRATEERRAEREFVRHIHPFHEMIALLRGSAVQLFGRERLPFEPGDVYFLPAKSWHIAGSRSTSCTWIVLNFYDGSFMDLQPGDREGHRIVEALARRALGGRPLLGLAPRTLKTVLACLDTMVEAGAHRQEFGRQCAIKANLLAILAALAVDPRLDLAADVRGRADPDTARIERMAAYVQKHLAEPLSVARLAQVAGLSPSHFHAVCRLRTGVSVIEYVTRVRVQAAADLLRTTCLPIKEVAGRCGFPCLSHFYAVFRRHTGLPPAQFVTAHGPAPTRT